jgi:eukaryotic-like serine/threonine-protein kinase
MATPLNRSLEDAAPVRPGDVLAGKYRVERVLAVGGMGVVVAAKHAQLDQLVALKFVLSAAADNPDAVERFVREARAAVRLRSEHVAKVLDVGTLDTGAPYIVMEYLEGSDLAAVLRAQGPLPVSDAADYIVQACDAVAEAHSLGIIHRDLKPQNLFLTRRADGSPLVKVLDFGISKTLPSLNDAASPQLTRTNFVLGSPLYMAPEQMRSPKNVDPRADVWALGVVLHELLAGTPPFRGESIPELCLKAISDPPEPILRSDVPDGLRAVIARCLEKDLAARYQDVAELATALAPFGGPGAPSLPARARVLISRSSRPRQRIRTAPMPPHTPVPPRTPAPGAPTPAAWVQREPPRAIRPFIFGGVTLALLLSVAGVVVYSLRHGRAEPTPAATADPAASEPLPVVLPVPVSASSPVPVAAPDPIPSAAVTQPAPVSSPSVVPPTTARRPRVPEHAPDAGRTAPRPSARPSDDDIPAMR